MVRNSGKFGKPKRGGAKRFTPARTLKAEAEDKEGMWEGKNSSDEDEDEDEEAEEDSDEDSDSDEDEQPSSALPSRASTSTTAGPSASTSAAPSTGVDKFGNMPELSAREAKKLAKQEKAQKAQADSDSDDEDDVLTAGRSNAGLTKQMKASSLGSTDTKPSKASSSQFGNKREREEAQKKIAREKYLELHRAGKTTEAKADLARLATIRKEREEAAARKAAEKADQDEAKAKAIAASGRKR